LFCIGCTQPASREGVPTAVEPEPATPRPEEPLVERDVPTTYDIEEEMQPEDIPVDPEELEDEIPPIPRDTVSVEEMAVEESGGSRHDLGYRVQILASSSLPGPERIKTLSTESGYPAYVEYEGGLYKIRLGNFTTRAEAAAARAVLVELYPDCWIVQTTIRR
jgi:hypothetical protein